MSNLKASCLINCIHKVFAPAFSCMLPHIGCGSFIACVKKTPHAGPATLSKAFEDMTMPPFTIGDLWNRCKAGIDRGCPILHQLLCFLVSNNDTHTPNKCLPSSASKDSSTSSVIPASFGSVALLGLVGPLSMVASVVPVSVGSLLLVGLFAVAFDIWLSFPLLFLAKLVAPVPTCVAFHFLMLISPAISCL